MTPSDASCGLEDSVPVSTADPHVQYSETLQRVPGALAAFLLACEPAHLMSALVVKGWTFGSDFELLPPRSWFEGNA